MIPTRNQARFIRQCIDGCFAQNIDGAEVVVVDGASTDDTRDVLASYGDRVRWISEPDRGQSDAINKGIGMATGDVIAWINSDDYYVSPTALQPLVTALEENPRLDIVYGDGERVDVEGGHIGSYRSRRIDRVSQIVTHPASFVLQPSLLFRRQVFLDVGGVDEALRYTMDYELWIRMFEAARATRYIPQVVACARYHTDAKSIAAMGKQIREAHRVKLAAADRLGMGIVERAKMLAGVASMAAYWIAVRTGIKRAS